MDAAAYKERFNNIASHGLISLSVALGHKLGIFDLMKKSTEPFSCKEIADRLQLKERYVQEWLGGMVAAEIVFLDKNGKYFIPEDCKDALGFGHLAAAVPLLAKVFDKTLACFRIEGPRGYDYYDRFDFLEWLDDEEKDSMGEYIDHILLPSVKKYKGSFQTVLDVGCGTGRLSVALSKKFPSSSIQGVDTSLEALGKARNIAAEQHCTNVEYIAQSAYDLPDEWTNKFDWIIMYDVLHDFPHPKLAMKEINRTLKDDGILSVVDPMVHSNHSENTGNSRAAVFYTYSVFNCLPCSLSSENGAGHGIGWGVEGEETFLKENGMQILDQQCIGPLKSATLFTCKLAENTPTRKFPRLQ